MATTATLTLNAPDFTGGGSFSVTTTLYKAGTNTDIDQFTGLARVYKSAATADISETGPETFVLMEVGSNEPIGRLFPGDWMFIPVDGTENFKATTSADGMSFEWGLFHQG